MIDVIQGFKVGSAVSIDDRLVKTKAELDSANTNLIPDVYFAICRDDGLLYLYKKGEGYRKAVPEKVGQLENDSNYDTVESVNAKDAELENYLDTNFSLINETAKTISLTVDDNYVVTVKLFDKNDVELSSSNIDLPIESSIVNIEYVEEDDKKYLVFTLRNGNKTKVPVDAIISGLATETYVNTKIQEEDTAVKEFVASKYYNKEESDATKAELQANIDDKANSTDVYTKVEANTLFDTKQNKLIAGDNVTIAEDGVTISAKDTVYHAGPGITISENNEIGTQSAAPAFSSIRGNRDNLYKNAVLANEFNSKVNVEEDKSLMSSDEHEKLAGIEEGANRYELPTDVVQDSEYNHTDNNYTTDEKNKLESLENYDDSAISERIKTIEDDYLKTADKTELNDLITSEANTARAAEQANSDAISGHINDNDNPHEVTKAQVGLGDVANTGDSATPEENGTKKFTTGGAYTELNKKVDKIKISEEGQPERYKVLSENDFTDTLKSKLDAISDSATNVASSAINGNIKIDGAETTVYTEVANTVHDAAYKHIDVTEVSVTNGETTFNKYVHPTYTKADAEAKKIGRDETGHVVIGDSLTKSDVGLSDVDNTSDANKPVSEATQTALNNKVDKVKMTTAEGQPERYKVLSANDFTDVLKTKVDGISDGANKVEASSTNGNIKIDGVETTVYTEVANTVHDANYKHIGVTDTSVTDGVNTFNQYVLDSKFDATIEAVNKVKVNEIDAPVSDGSSTYNTGYEGQILTAGSDGTVYWKDGYKPGTGVSVTGQYISTTYTVCTVATDAWVEVQSEEETPTTLYYKADVNVAGVTEASNPTLDIKIGPTEYAQIDQLNEAWSKVYSAETSVGKITFYATEKPTIQMSVQVKGY